MFGKRESEEASLGMNLTASHDHAVLHLHLRGGEACTLQAVFICLGFWIPAKAPLNPFEYHMARRRTNLEGHANPRVENYGSH